jgi:hypothetical protein
LSSFTPVTVGRPRVQGRFGAISDDYTWQSPKHALPSLQIVLVYIIC